MYITDFAYDRPISLVPLSLSYASLPVYIYNHELSLSRRCFVATKNHSMQEPHSVNSIGSMLLPSSMMLFCMWMGSAHWRVS